MIQREWRRAGRARSHRAGAALRADGGRVPSTGGGDPAALRWPGRAAQSVI